MPQLVWRKSSYSVGQDGDCVEVAPHPGGLIRVRESDDPDFILTASPAAFAGLLRDLKRDIKAKTAPAAHHEAPRRAAGAP
ncbi:hypothetical protein BLA24_26710 [Streptomyces cinnamoneus]|uniref:DUF397 domain-containing protein n=1 Tax=Streptomyces cinnamoneus TaxID=53446 RepID=A0A2G1XEE5_STRCJ|nr:DUF397 domain-containing protein [Streptomyces cinnamoneus]PHQ49614.1 hypothetical protein BLA24_26710 [Streptomyces cinnamoneus]PPT14666.1 DUF397 domain-containing protein [Streptomyces cinnamoneus]